MKITPLLAFCAALLLAIAPRTARAADITFDVFYNSLADDGEWYNTPEYGYVFQPDVAYNNEKWRPYTDGYWAQTEDGWTWVAYENFGWATYHYGRWTRLKDTGWVWVPGYEWGPGWVSWRTSDDKVGWAPLPPKANIAYVDGKDIREEAPRARTTVDYSDVEEDYDTGYTPAVDEDYDIGPESYCFVETRRFGDPRLSEVILPPQENFVYVENSVNVTYISYQRDHDRRFIYNRGPDFDFIRGRCERPIQELRIERHDDLGFIQNGRRGGGNFNRVQNGVFQVAAPAIARRPMDFQQLRPNKVKRTLDRPQVLRGWQNVKADPQQVTQLREKIKDQAKQPRPADAAGAGRQRRPEAAAMPPAPEPAAVNPAPPAPGTPLTEEEHAARRAARKQAHAQNKTGAPAVAQPGALVEQPGQPGQPPVTDADKAARKAARHQARDQAATPPAVNPTAPQPPAVSPDADKAARRAARQQAREQQQQQQPQGGAVPPAAPAPQNQPPAVDPDKAARKAARQQQQQQAQAAQQQQQQQQQQQAQQQVNEQRAARQQARQAQQQQQAVQEQQQRPQRSPEERAARQQARQLQQQQQQPQQAPPQIQQQQQRPQRSPEERAARQEARQAQQAQAQPQAQPQPTQGDDDKKKKKDRQ